MINSSERTAKVILNSDLRNNGTPVYGAMYNLITPIRTPNRQIGLTCVESCMIKAPSFFHDGVIENNTNTLLLATGSNLELNDLFSNIQPLTT